MDKKYNDPLKQAVDLLKKSTRAVALTGAGISTPSGIPDFHSPVSGLWEKYNPMEVASLYSFKRKPQDFYEWIHPLAKLILEAEPNAAHKALADLETYGPVMALITQNIDNLHQRAGSKSIYEVHGHLREATCIDCGQESGDEQMLLEFVRTGQIPRCKSCAGILKPNVTLYGEIPPIQVFNSAEHAALTCDLMLIAGSSLGVMPVGDLPRIAKFNGASLIIVTYSETPIDFMADVLIHEDVAEVLPQLSAPFLP